MGGDIYKPIYSKCNAFKTLNLINNLLNNVVFLILSLIVDLIKILHSNKVIKYKRSINCPHLDKAIKYREKLTKTIIITDTLFFIAHQREFLITILLIIFTNTLREFCFGQNVCSEIIEMAHSIHLISIGFQFFIFKNFDRNFKESYNNRKTKRCGSKLNDEHNYHTDSNRLFSEGIRFVTS